MLGGAGTGKTHIATAIGHYAIRNGMKVFYATVKELLYFIKTQNTIGKSRTRLGYIHGCELLIVDEFSMVDNYLLHQLLRASQKIGQIMQYKIEANYLLGTNLSVGGHFLYEDNHLPA